VAAIFPERFQSFTIALKNYLFLLFFNHKTVSAVCQNINKNKQPHSGKMKQQEGAEQVQSLDFAPDVP
jgi:hypothetical protein